MANLTSTESACGHGSHGVCTGTLRCRIAGNPLLYMEIAAILFVVTLPGCQLKWLATASVQYANDQSARGVLGLLGTIGNCDML